MSSKDYIKIISYNILADYLNSHEFNLVKKKYLDNNFRIKLLIKHLKEIFKKDTTDTILCLQEVGSTQLSALYIWLIILIINVFIIVIYVYFILIIIKL